MSDFELIAISLSFILGLGVAQMLTAVMELIREHRTVQFDWVPLIWFCCILAWHFQIWFGALHVDQLTEWNSSWYLGFVAASGFLFLSGGLVLPRPSGMVDADLCEYFEARGRMALFPLAGFLVVSLVLNSNMGLGYFAAPNLPLWVMLPLLVAVLVTKRRSVSAVGSMLFLGLVIYGFLFQWSVPGELVRTAG
jgi:hypothetical protein